MDMRLTVEALEPMVAPLWRPLYSIGTYGELISDDSVWGID